MQTNQDQCEPVGDACFNPNTLNPEDRNGEMGKEEVMTQKTHIPPSSKKSNNPSPTDLSARKKHDAMLPQLLNADPLAQIIGTETIADVIIDDVEACALLDSGATANLMTSAYAEARGFDIRPITELSDQYVNLNLALGHSFTATGYVEYNLHVGGSHHTILIEWPS